MSDHSDLSAIEMIDQIVDESDSAERNVDLSRVNETAQQRALSLLWCRREIFLNGGFTALHRQTRSRFGSTSTPKLPTRVTIKRLYALEMIADEDPENRGARGQYKFTQQGEEIARAIIGDLDFIEYWFRCGQKESKRGRELAERRSAIKRSLTPKRLIALDAISNTLLKG